MLRNGAARALTRSFLKQAPSNARKTFINASSKLQLHSSARVARCRLPSTLALSPYAPATTALLRYVSSTTANKIDKEAEERVGKLTLEPTPEEVTPGSSVRHVFHEEGVTEEEEKDTDMMAGIRADLKTIKETFSLTEVPKEALYIGLAGVLPYLATSLSTVYLAWDINHAALTGSGFLLSGETAEALLHILEPLQIGYGAVIISFLGAIHWGLEWAKYGGEQGYGRYSIGVIAPAVAWPTTLMPVEYALISQFLAFNYLYYVDTRAAAKGWCPPWYGTYRFVLTFIVGASIVASLIGRGQIADKITTQEGVAARVRALQDAQLADLQKEDKVNSGAEEEEEDEV